MDPHMDYTYSISGTSENSKKYLGVLNFHSHTEMICFKALKTICFVLRVSKEFNLYSLH